MSKRIPPLIAALCALIAAGATAYCGIEIGPAGRSLSPPGSQPPSVLYPYPVESPPPNDTLSLYAPD